MYKYKSFSLNNNPLLFLLHCEVSESLNESGWAVDRVVSAKLEASVDSKKRGGGGFIPISYALSE